MATTINVAKLDLINDSQDSLKFETIASCKWLNEQAPTILVPGVPPIRDPPQINPVSKPDIGGHTVDQNADDTPGSPLQALIHAGQTCQLGFDFTNVNVITIRKPIRCLLGFGEKKSGTPFEADFGDTKQEHEYQVRSSLQTLPTKTPITVIDGDRHISHAARLELTTRAQHNQAPDSVEHKIPEFWISQTLNYHLCLHRDKKDGSTRSTIFHRIRLILIGEKLIGWEKTNAEKLHALVHVLGPVIKAVEELGGSCVVSSDGSEGTSLKVTIAKGEEVPALPKDMQSLFLPIKNEAVNVPIMQQEVAITASTAGQDGTRMRKYGTGDAHELTGSPPARITLNSTFRTPSEVAVSSKDEEFAVTTGTTSNYGTGKRKLDAEDAPELTGSPAARRRALNSVFRTPGQAVAPIEKEERSVKIKNKPVEIEMAM